MMRLITKTLLTLTFVISSIVLQRAIVTPLFDLNPELTKSSNQPLQLSLSSSETLSEDIFVGRKASFKTAKRTSYQIEYVEYKEQKAPKKYSDKKIRKQQRLAWKKMKRETSKSKKDQEKKSPSIQKKKTVKRPQKDFRIEELKGVIDEDESSTDSGQKKNMAMRDIELGKHSGFKVKRPKVFKTASLLKKANIGQRLAQLKKEERERRKRAPKKREATRVASAKPLEKTVVDEVATKQASPQSQGSYDPTNVENFNKQPNGSPLADAMKEMEKLKETKTKETKRDKSNEDLTVFDYSSDESANQERDDLNELFVGSQKKPRQKKKKVLEQSSNANHMGQLTDVKISRNVQNVIKRELKGKTGVSKAKDVSSQAPMKDMTTHAPKMASHQNGNTKPQNGNFPTGGQVDYAKLFRAGVKKLEKGVNSQTRMVAYQPGLGMAKEKDVRNFEFVPEYNKNKYFVDENEGFVEIKKNLNNSKSIMRGTFLKNGHVRTKAEVVLEKGVGSFKVPFFKEETLYNFLDSKDLRGYGAFLLLELGESISNVALDTQYEAKIFLNDDLEPIKEGKDHRYVMFVGVNAGNTLISYETHEGDIADHVAHLVPDEVLYIPAILHPEGEEKLTLEERNIMSREGTPLKMDSSRINYFNQDVKVERKALNHYSLVRPVRPLGMRKYFEIDSPLGFMMAGTEDAETIEIPSQDFVDQVFDQLRIDDLKGRCLIQLNFEKRVEEFRVNGETRKGPMYLDKYFLDSDGIFNRRATTLATKAFVLGDLQGVMNIQITYQDGSEDVAQTFCSEETYLVEHF